MSLAVLVCVGGPTLAGPRGGRLAVPHPRAAARFFGTRVPAGNTLSQSDPNAERLLRQMLVAENNLTLAGTQVTMVSGGATSEQRVLRNGARALRLDYDQPPQMRGEQIVDDGKTYFHFLPKQNKVETQASQVHSLRVRVPQVIQQVRQGQLLVQWVGQDTVAGHACAIVDVTTRGGPTARQRFWIDPTNGAQLKIEQYNAADKLLSVSYYTSVSYNPPLNAHSFDPPQAPTASVPQARPQQTVPTPSQVGFVVLQPSFLPPGFHWQSAAVTEYQGRKVAALRYTNGLGLLSLYETRDNGSEKADAFPHPGVLVGQRKGLKIVLIGNQGRPSLRNVINSLR